jgi:hypothetical protein
VQSLKRKIHLLEEVQRKRIHLTSPTGSTPFNGNQPHEAPTTASNTDDNGALESTKDRFGRFVLNFMATDGSTHSLRSNYHVSPWTMLRAASESTQVLEMQSDPSYRDMLTGLPRMRDRQITQLVNEYCNLILIRFPFVTRATLESFCLRASSSLTSTGGEAFTADTFESHAILYLVIATLDFAAHSSVVRRMRAFQLHHHALQLMCRHMSPSRPIATLQCLVALTVCAYHHPSAGSVWHFVDITAGEAIALGLHHCVQTSDNDDLSEVGEVRRLMAVVSLINQ